VIVLALDEVHIHDEPLGLGADHALDLAAHAVGDPRGVIHHAADIVEQLAAGLGHLRLRCGRSGPYLGGCVRLDQPAGRLTSSPASTEPGRVPFPNIDPIAFQLGPFAVRWYALGYLAGVFLGAWYATSLLNRPQLWARDKPPFPTPAIWDFAFWAVIGIVLG